MKFAIVLLALVAVALCHEDYEMVLQSPGALMALFSKFSAQHSRHYTAAEAPMRIRIFRDSLKSVVVGNKQHGDEWESGLNDFSDMTQEEKHMHLGLNMSMKAEVEEVEVEERDALSLAPRASDMDWRSQGKVTGIKNQGSCGSCWAFSAVGAVETNYAIATGRRKQFAEQEYLDCTYASSRDGCKGGWYYDAWNYSKRSGRLATAANAKYTGKDGYCSYARKANGLMAATIKGYSSVRKGESNMIYYLGKGAVSVAYEVTDAFFEYTTGIINDSTCKSYPNHAVTAVGYTRSAMIVRNSWGAWGMKGYFYTRRGAGGCGIWDYGKIPIMSKTGRRDTDPEYVPTDDDSCNGTNADGCPCGTVRCSNGQCKHAHMCH